MSFVASAYEAVTIDNTAGGVGLTAATFLNRSSAVIGVETAQIRFTVDGTAPTTTVGLLADSGAVIHLNTRDQMQKFKAIRTGSTSGTLRCTYGEGLEDFKVGAGGSTGASSGVVSSATITTIKTTVTRPSDTNAYAVGDCFSDSTSAPTSGGFTFTSAARTSDGTGKITDAVISMSAKSAFQGELWVFDQAATNTNDNAAITLSAADVLNCVAVIPFTVNDTGSVAGLSYVQGIDARFTCVGTANLRFLVKVIAAFTPASAEVLGITLHVEN